MIFEKSRKGVKRRLKMNRDVQGRKKKKLSSEVQKNEGVCQVQRTARRPQHLESSEQGEEQQKMREERWIGTSMC